MQLTDLTATMRHERDRGVVTTRLQQIADARVDIVAPQKRIAIYENAGQGFSSSLTLDEPLLLGDGVYNYPILVSDLSRTAFTDLASRLEIPLSYLDRLTEKKHRDLVRTNVNTLSERDDRVAFYRYLHLGDEWLLRAVCSDRYRPIDNIDLLVAVAKGMTQGDLSLADADVEADWTMDRFRLRVAVPSVAVLAEDILADYRMPFSVDPNRGVHDPAGPGEKAPIIWAGFEVSNSETGGGAAVLKDRAMVLRCRNGLTESKDLLRQIHAGRRQDEGIVDWSEETRRLSLELLTSEIADAVRTFCSQEHLDGLVNRMRAAKGFEVASITDTIELVQTRLGFTDEETRSVLDCFVAGGDHTVLGIGQAVTAAAQLVDSTDRQSEMEATFWQIVDHPEVYA